MSFTVSPETELDHAPGWVSIDDGSHRAGLHVRIDLETHDELEAAALLARELLAACDDCEVSDEPGTRERTRQTLEHLIDDARAWIIELDAADRCTCTLANVDGRAELASTGVPCPVHADVKVAP